MSRRLTVLNRYLARVEKPALARLGPDVARRRFDRQAALFRDPLGARYRAETLGGVPVTWAETGPEGAGAGVIIWLHGGAHVIGSVRTHRAMVARLAQLCGWRACLPEMRRAPEHPFPAALEDAGAVWEALRAAGHDRIVLAGNSSGGGLALALAARLLARGEHPAALVLMSPWTDLTGTATSLRENADRDVLLPVTRFDEARRLYLGTADPRDPGASPLFADFPGCPPVWIQASRAEILRDDSLHMADHLRAGGAEVELDLSDDLPHVCAIFQGWLPEADEVLDHAARFIRARCPAGSSGGR
ncbi:alpha/beta fold hydrolase [Pseudooceanicola sp. LIPI14-2-Ac024]|uniref:alpha/beta fold hydrolase n=1 Tax=Pseudooceanicola sp. LIPI14-2-Ac024 TaxID=3344875 RepID=UPI0035CF555C